MMVTNNQMKFGLLFPIEGYSGGIPQMKNQVQLAQLAEEKGFFSLWVRDVPLYDKFFGDAGQMYDPLLYLLHIAHHTKKIKLGTASLILPLRHPVHVAKSSATFDHLAPGRLRLGVASGDRAAEYPAFGKDISKKGELFREAFETLREIWKQKNPVYANSFGYLEGEMEVLPKPEQQIPLYVTGCSGNQSMDWIAKNADGWLYYPRNLSQTENNIRDWRQALEKNNTVLKPYMQSLYIDLSEDPDRYPTPIHLGFRIGRKYLLEYLKVLQGTGVNEVIFVTKYASRPLDEIIQELGEYILPEFESLPCYPG